MERSTGERIRKGRALRGMTLRELADKVGVSHTHISNLERGGKEITGATLIALSEALDLPIDYFVCQDTPAVEAVSFRKLKAFSSKEDKKIWQKIERQLENYLELEEIMDIKTFFDRDEIIRDTSTDIEEVAKEVRQLCHLGLSPISNVSSLLETMGIKVIGVAGKKGFDGVSFFANEVIPVIAYNSNIGSTERKRLTLLHELAHLLLKNSLEAIPEKEGEKLCTAFASHLLLPDEIIREFFGGRRKRFSIPELIELQSTYGISIDAIVYRLSEMQLISQSNCRGYFIKKNKSEELREILEKSRYVEPQSNRFSRLVIKALDLDLITQAKAQIYLQEAGIPADQVVNLLNANI